MPETLTTGDAAALRSPYLRVVAPTDDAVLARMARFTEGDAHERARAAVITAMPATERVERAAAALTRASLDGRPDAPFDAMGLARAVPVTALGRLLELPPAVPPLVQQLCQRLAAGADIAPVTAALADVDTAALSILFQAHDAGAALIGLRLLGLDRPPVRTTRRQATVGVALRDATAADGDTVVVDLAECGTFGAGPHACPGQQVALALARAVVDTVHGAGWHAVAGQPTRFEPRPNLNLPSEVLVARSWPAPPTPG